MNWGYRITIAFALFIIFIVSMVVIASSKSADLVAEDYYSQEVNYQEIIDARNNSVEIKRQFKIKQDNNNVKLVFPESVGDKIEGTVHFYHPQNAKNDMTSELSLSASNEQLIDKSKLLKGNYTVKIFWKEGDKNYYIEKSCFVS
jgi:hypothetical protein